jgi:membrane peptidoglycan carboxypeptidase
VSVPGPPQRNAYDDVLGHIAARRRKRRLNERRRGRRSLAATALVTIAVIFVSVLVAGGVGATVAVSDVLKGVDLKSMKAHYPGVTTKIYDRNGNLLAQIPSLQNRTPVPYGHISKWLKFATVDVEDKRFWQHGGVDYEGIARAFLDDIQAGHAVQGASTIEQQLARNLYLTDTKTLDRKIKEAWLAIQMAEHWSKQRILNTYLNVIPYGGVTYGCEAAAETYFDEHCSQLTIRQAALIAGLPQSPTDYNPRLHPAAALQRRNEVLAAMFDQGHITLSQYQRAVSEGLGLRKPKRFTRVRQPYFVQYVNDQLRAKYGGKALKSGGLSVNTTIDPTLQAAAHQAMTQELTGADWGTPSNAPAAALVAVDPRTGAILAMQSSTDFSKSKYNLAVQSRRQAGSTFKSFGLIAAMVDDHIDPNVTRYSAAPLENYPIVPFPTPGNSNDYWTVQNAEPAEGGVLPLSTALEQSVNAVYARLAIDIGGQNVANMAYKLGIPESDHLPTSPSVILGAGGVSPLDMTHAYSTIADQGIRHPLLAITKVTPYGGKPIKTPASKNKGHRVVPDGATWQVTQYLDTNVHSCCTGTRANVQNYDLPYRAQAGKTGTTDDYTDAWFCGYTPNLAACVWTGYPKGEISMLDLRGSIPGPAFGGNYSATIWGLFAAAAFRDEPKAFPPTPWPIAPTQPIQFRPWKSKFSLPTTHKGKKHGGGSGSTGGGSGGGGSSGGGGGGGTTTSPPPPPPTSTQPPPPTT